MRGGSFKTHWNQIYRCERKLKLKLDHRRCDQGVYRIARGQHPQHQIPTKFSQIFRSFRRCLKRQLGYMCENLSWGRQSVGSVHFLPRFEGFYLSANIGHPGSPDGAFGGQARKRVRKGTHKRQDSQRWETTTKYSVENLKKEAQWWWSSQLDYKSVVCKVEKKKEARWGPSDNPPLPMSIIEWSEKIKIVNCNFHNPGTLKAYPWTPWDPLGLPLDPLGPCRPTPWPPGTLYAYPLTPWDPVCLPLEPLGPI